MYPAPSPRLSPALLSSNGLHSSLSNIIRDLKPFKVNALKASQPPTITASNTPCFNKLYPFIIALADEEHAVLIVVE